MPDSKRNYIIKTTIHWIVWISLFIIHRPEAYMLALVFYLPYMIIVGLGDDI